MSLYRIRDEHGEPVRYSPDSPLWPEGLARRAMETMPRHVPGSNPPKFISWREAGYTMEEVAPSPDEVPYGEH